MQFLFVLVLAKRLDYPGVTGSPNGPIGLETNRTNRCSLDYRRKRCRLLRIAAFEPLIATRLIDRYYD